MGAAKRETAGGPERRATRRGGRGRPEELVANKDQTSVVHRDGARMNFGG